MGKLKGIVQFTGTIDELSFYKLNGKIVVRKAGGGFDGKAIKTQDKYIRTRENSSEFGASAALGKQLRIALASYVRKIKTPYLHNRVVGLLSQIMKFDTVSERGKRKVSIGLASEEGKRLLHGFEFNAAQSLPLMVSARYRVLIEEGKVVFEDFDVDGVAFPQYATHISLRFLLLRFDFGSGAFVLNEGEDVVVGRKDTVDFLELTAGIPDGNGILIGLVFGEFWQELNGELYGVGECGLRVVGCE